MSKYGIEGMSGFVRAADQINVAIVEEIGADATFSRANATIDKDSLADLMETVVRQ